MFLTGAGASAESGVPTFRGPEGLWKRHRPETLATPEAFRRDPRLVWEWYAWRRERVAGCDPNPAHRSLARFVRGHEGSRIVTQNVDGLHERAAREESGAAEGTPRERPLELHGSLFRTRCTGCSGRSPLVGPVDASREDTLPRCERCGSLLRPDVVWFGEALDPGVVEEAFEVAEAAALCVVVGTSAVVQPAASLPIATLRAGGTVVEVNPEPTALSPACTVSLHGPAGVVVPELLG